jgi:hypothetical protein
MAWTINSKSKAGHPRKDLACFCPKCGSDNLFFADKGEPNDDCFQCGGCNALMENEKIDHFARV